MTKKEKKELLKEIKADINKYSDLKKLIAISESKLLELNNSIELNQKRNAEILETVNNYKIIVDLEEMIKSLRAEVDEFISVKNLVFAEYAVTDADAQKNNYNLGIFRAEKSSEGMTYNCITSPNLIAFVDNCGDVVDHLYGISGYASIESLMNIISFSDVLQYTKNKNLILKENITKDQILETLEFLLDNASSFGLEGYEEKAKLMQKSKQ